MYLLGRRRWKCGIVAEKLKTLLLTVCRPRYESRGNGSEVCKGRFGTDIRSRYRSGIGDWRSVAITEHAGRHTIKGDHTQYRQSSDRSPKNNVPGRNLCTDCYSSRCQHPNGINISKSVRVVIPPTERRNPTPANNQDPNSRDRRSSPKSTTLPSHNPHADQEVLQRAPVATPTALPPTATSPGSPAITTSKPHHPYRLNANTPLALTYAGSPALSQQPAPHPQQTNTYEPAPPTSTQPQLRTATTTRPQIEVGTGNTSSLNDTDPQIEANTDTAPHTNTTHQQIEAGTDTASNQKSRIPASGQLQPGIDIAPASTHQPQPEISRNLTPAGTNTASSQESQTPGSRQLQPNTDIAPASTHQPQLEISRSFTPVNPQLQINTEAPDLQHWTSANRQSQSGTETASALQHQSTSTRNRNSNQTSPQPQFGTNVGSELRPQPSTTPKQQVQTCTKTHQPQLKNSRSSTPAIPPLQPNTNVHAWMPASRQSQPGTRTI